MTLFQIEILGLTMMNFFKSSIRLMMLIQRLNGFSMNMGSKTSIKKNSLMSIIQKNKELIMMYLKWTEMQV